MKRSVLVVDDNVYLTRATAQALEAQGLQACGAMNATQALKLVAAQEFDGAIIDIDLKDASMASNCWQRSANCARDSARC